MVRPHTAQGLAGKWDLLPLKSRRFVLTLLRYGNPWRMAPLGIGDRYHDIRDGPVSGPTTAALAAHHRRAGPVPRKVSGGCSTGPTLSPGFSVPGSQALLTEQFGNALAEGEEPPRGVRPGEGVPAAPDGRERHCL